MRFQFSFAILLVCCVHAGELSLEQLAERGKRFSAQTGNLLAGGNFDAGLSNGWSFPTSADVDPNTLKVGHQSLRCLIPANRSVQVLSPPVLLYPGRNYTVSFWAKSSQARTKLAVAITGTKLQQQEELKGEWRRMTLSGTAPAVLRPCVKLTMTSAHESHVWIDGIMLEELPAPSPKFVAHTDFDLTLHLAAEAKLKIGLAADDLSWITAIPGSQLQVECKNDFGQGRHVPWIQLPIDSMDLPAFAKTEFGIFHLYGEVADLEGRLRTDPVTVAWMHLPPHAVPSYRLLKSLGWPENDPLRGKLAVFLSLISRGYELRSSASGAASEQRDVWGNVIAPEAISPAHRLIYAK
jgi:hypothetical protein